MATKFDIMTGANVRVHVGTSGKVLATDFKEVPEVAVFPTSGFERVVIDVVTYNNAYNRKLVGTKSVPDIDLTVNWLADDEVHQLLEKMSDLGKRVQVKIEYFEDETQETGVYIAYNAFVSSTAVSGDKDAVVQKGFTLAVDGGPVSSGIIDTTTP
ncbi:phage tail tube protein [Cedecea lapagei]|uniref:phage tail tube protein n=1 Tax=Cedecea lapagei TaxID=158823 RepID=UPI001BD1882F|nr:phage tail tube protein [Cedecea lapagei]